MHSNFSSFARTASIAAFVALASAVAPAQTVINANPGPANNGGSPNWAMFFDVAATGGDFLVTELTTASNAAANVQYTVEVFVRSGTALGGPVGSGPGSSSAGWTSLGTAPATQGGTASGISLPIDIPDISVLNGQTTGVALLFTGAGPRYFGTGTPAYSVYNDANLALTTGDGRSAPFTTTGSFFTSRALVGSITYISGSSGPVSYCTAGTSTNGCLPAITADAQPSATLATACNISVAGVEGQKSGLVFYGIDNSSYSPLPWGIGGSSYLCVKAPTQRMPTQVSGGNVGQCDGSLTQDWNAFQAANPSSLGNPFSAGQKVYLQAWYRDPSAVKSTNLSDGLELTLVP
jgi:hypothetical protein